MILIWERLENPSEENVEIGNEYRDWVMRNKKRRGAVGATAIPQ